MGAYHYPWSLLARALDAEGDWRRAEAVYWHARRRFPHTVHSHSQLARALVLHGHDELGEAVFRQATALFPDNPVCLNDLAHTLRIGRLEEAVNVYREAQERFRQDPVVANALTDTLIDLRRLPEAQDALDWAEQLAMDEQNRNKLAQIRRRLQQALSGASILLKDRPHRPEGPGGDPAALADIAGEDLSYDPNLGRAVLWRRRANGDLGRSLAELQSMWMNSASFVETGLWHAAAEGWRAAASSQYSSAHCAHRSSPDPSACAWWSRRAASVNTRSVKIGQRRPLPMHLPVDWL